MNNRIFSSLICAACLLTFRISYAADPQTPRRPVTHTYHSVTVNDPYEWLEQDDAAEVIAWSNSQNNRTREFIDKLGYRASVEKTLGDWIRKASPFYVGLISRPAALFAMKYDPAKQQPMLVMMA